MFFKYNAVLRGFPQAVVDGLMGNTYPTTIHLIVSGVIKLSRCVDPRPSSRTPTAESSRLVEGPETPQAYRDAKNVLAVKEYSSKPRMDPVLDAWIVLNRTRALLAMRDCPTGSGKVPGQNRSPRLPWCDEAGAAVDITAFASVVHGIE